MWLDPALYSDIVDRIAAGLGEGRGGADGDRFTANAEDVGLTVHAHPTLSETVMLAAEIATGTVTDAPNPKAQRKSKSA